MKYNNLLDASCGDHLHDWIQYYSLVNHTTSVDIDNNCLGRNDSDEFYRLNLNTEGLEKFDDKTFDIVLSDHTIEHLDDPLSFYKELCRVTRKMLIIKTPQGWQENIFKPIRLIKCSHKFQFSKKWFIKNNTSDFNIKTRTNMRFGLSNSIGEIEVILRRNKK